MNEDVGRGLRSWKIWQWAILGVGIFCLARGVTDFVDDRYLWGLLGILAGLFLLLTPIPTEAMKFDLEPRR
jgi:hypothetical protein